MKKKYSFLLLLLSPILAFTQTWQPLPMFGGGFITDVILHPTNPSVIVGVCDVGGIFISTDDCQTWTSHTANVPKTDYKNFYTRSFAFDPITPNTQYFVSGDAPYQSTGKIWKTTNNGGSWTPTNLPVNISGNNDARFAGATILVNPLTTNKLYVVGQPTFNYGSNSFNTDSGLAMSTDGGATWTKIGGATLDKANMTKLKFAPNDPSVIYFSAIATSVNGVSSTGTGLWTYNTTTATLTQLTTHEVLDFDFDAVSNSTIITTSNAENRVSINGGTTWTPLSTPTGLQYGLFASAHPTQGGVWYFGTFSFASNTIVTTSDGGTTWSQVKYSGTHNASKVVHPAYLATNDKPSFGNYMACLVIRSGKAYLSDWYGVWKTTDAASPLVNSAQPATSNSNWTWSFLSQGIHNMVQVRTSLHPTDPNRFYANVADLHYYESTNAGLSMTYTDVAPMNMTCRIDFHKDNPLIGYMCGTQEHGDIGKIFKTTNGGTSWNEIAASTFNGGAYNITDLQLTPSVNTLIVGIEKHSLPSQVYRSNDGGTTWVAWDNGLTTNPSFRTWEKVDHLLKDADGETFYIFRDNKLFRRKLTDAAWVELAVPVPANWISGVQTSRTTAGTIYLGQYTTNIYKSTNNGTTWTAIPTVSNVGTFAVAPNGSNILYQSWNVSDEQILKQSQNGGTTWSDCPTTGFWGMMSGFTFLNDTKVIGWSVGNSGFSTNLSAPLPNCAQLVWSDEFNGSSLDLTKWTPVVGEGGAVSGNAELQYYTSRSQNIQVSNGTLKIIALAETNYLGSSNNYTSARMQTKNIGDWRYGRIEARIKLPVAQGMWPAFWLLPTDNVYGIWPRSGEMDIMELIGKEPSHAYATIHTSNDGTVHSFGGRYDLPSGTFADDFHVFSMDWSPNLLKFYVDGNLYTTKTNTDVSPYPWVYDKRFYILLNLAIGGSWAGAPDGTTTFPQQMEVDYVRVYQNVGDLTMLGKILVEPNTPSVIYSVPSINNVTYQWSVTGSGNTISAGQGTAQASVNWGNASGTVSVVINDGCTPSASVSTPVTVSPNLWDNFGFEQNYVSWDTRPAYSSTATFNITTSDFTEGSKASCVQINTASPTTPWNIQLSRTNLNLIAGTNYTLSFYAKADVNRTIPLAFIRPVVFTGVASSSAPLTTTWKKYSMSFTPANNETVMFNADLAGQVGTVCFDNFTFARTAILPAELLNFSGYTEGGCAVRGQMYDGRCKHVINWETSAELNTDNFELQQLMSDNSFKTIATIKANNKATQYSFTNDQTSGRLEASPTLITYYRLKINDHDGKTTYSKTISLENKSVLRGLKVYPNPANDVLFIENAEEQDIQIINTLGQVVMSVSKNIIHYPLSIIHYPLSIIHLKSGLYFVKCKDEMVRFVKN